ncbi:hypothetical protein JCM8547_007741 [Rhodosporidiobolus lusitaniae]
MAGDDAPPLSLKQRIALLNQAANPSSSSSTPDGSSLPLTSLRQPATRAAPPATTTASASLKADLTEATTTPVSPTSSRTAHPGQGVRTAASDGTGGAEAALAAQMTTDTSTLSCTQHAELGQERRVSCSADRVDLPSFPLFHPFFLVFPRTYTPSPTSSYTRPSLCDDPCTCRRPRSSRARPSSPTSWLSFLFVLHFNLTARRTPSPSPPRTYPSSIFHHSSDGPPLTSPNPSSPTLQTRLSRPSLHISRSLASPPSFQSHRLSSTSLPAYQGQTSPPRAHRLASVLFFLSFLLGPDLGRRERSRVGGGEGKAGGPEGEETVRAAL